MDIQAIERAGQAVLPDATPPIKSSTPPATTSVPPTRPKGFQSAPFLAGILSGWTKLIIGHPFDTIKTRLQCAPPSMYKGAVDCFVKTVTREGPRKLYAGAMVPALGWSLTDGLLMGSLDNYRSFLLHNPHTQFFLEPDPNPSITIDDTGGIEKQRLNLWGHGLAGMGAGWSNAGVAHPVEMIKSKLQLQYTLDAAKAFGPTVSPSTSIPSMTSTSTNINPTSISATRAFSTTTTTLSPSSHSTIPQHPAHSFHATERFKNPYDVVAQTVKAQGVKGMWRGFTASLVFRSSFAFMFGGFEFFNRQFDKLKGTPYEMSKSTGNFIAGGMASNLYWASALPFDNVKNRLMTDSLSKPKYKGVVHSFMTILHEKDLPTRSQVGNMLAGGRNFYRGIVPVALRAFPTNAAALAVWEAVMRNVRDK